MRIVAFSDTHALHREAFGLNAGPSFLPEGDILLCAGDITNNGDIYDVNDFGDYFSATKFSHKISIAGNHDWCFEKNRLYAKECLTNKGWIYLQDEEIIIDGIKIYGSPWQPRFFDWAFNVDRGEKIARVWDNIPLDTDVLVTHGPPVGILDYTIRDGFHVGCEELLPRVLKIKPKLHLFGHIHEGYGLKEVDEILFCNASTCTAGYKPINAPFVFDLNTKTKEIKVIS